MNDADLCETDILPWAEHQADAFRRRASNELDRENTPTKSRAWAAANYTPSNRFWPGYCATCSRPKRGERCAMR